MQKHKTRSYLTFLLITILCTAWPITSLQAAAFKIQDEEYAVLAAAINHGTGTNAKPILIGERTTGEVINLFAEEQPIEELAKELSTSVTALKNWQRNNQKRYLLSQAIPTAITHGSLAEAEKKQIFMDPDPEKNWRRLRERFPGTNGIVRLSRPGIDDVTNTALLYIEFECGPECASGRVINLAKDQSGIWSVVSGALIWITSPK